MKIHEYQAKEILKSYGVPVPKGKIASTVKEAEQAAQEIGLPVVVKAQIHAGGRGKGGGVKFAPTAQDVSQYASDILGMTLITHQTGPEGRFVKKVWIEEASNIKHEYYAGIVLDRATSKVTFMVSTEGGMEIEEVSAKTPEKITTVHVDTSIGLQPYHIRNLCIGFGFSKKLTKSFNSIIQKLYSSFFSLDMSLLEINPLVVTNQEEFILLDSKISLDDNALYRQPKLEQIRDLAEEEDREIEASKYDLNYIGLNGNIGCLVNGAGLAMATMDIIKYYGGDPANFLDVGGGATEKMVKNAFKIILSDEKVKAVFVNIFGGIMRCDIIASGIVGAIRELGLKVPLVVRLEGTNVDEGKKILKDSDLAIIIADNMSDGAKKAVELGRSKT